MSKFDRNHHDDDLTSLQSDDASLKNLIELVNKIPTRFSLLIRFYLIQNCYSKHIICSTVRCHSGPFRSNRQAGQFWLHSAINITSIESTLKGIDFSLIKYTVDASVLVLDNLTIANSTGQMFSSTNVIILFRKLPISQQIELWIILLSIAIGLLLLTMIIIGLVKVNYN